jgi:hypothetical protein
MWWISWKDFRIWWGGVLCKVACLVRGPEIAEFDVPMGGTAGGILWESWSDLPPRQPAGRTVRVAAAAVAPGGLSEFLYVLFCHDSRAHPLVNYCELCSLQVQDTWVTCIARTKKEERIRNKWFRQKYGRNWRFPIWPGLTRKRIDALIKVGKFLISNTRSWICRWKPLLNGLARRRFWRRFFLPSLAHGGAPGCSVGVIVEFFSSTLSC